MDQEAKSNVNLILEALEIIKEKRTGQYLDNICEICKNEFGWDAERTKLALDEAEKENIIHEVKVKRKISYRKTGQAVIIHDVEESEEDPQRKDEKSPEKRTENEEKCEAVESDYLELKRFIHSEILALKAQTPSRSNDRQEDINVYAKALIQSLEDRVRSLERQLEQKKAIIEKLLDGPRQVVRTLPTPNPLGAEEVRNGNFDTKENKEISSPSIETTNQTKGGKNSTIQSSKAGKEEIQRNRKKLQSLGTPF